MAILVSTLLLVNATIAATVNVNANVPTGGGGGSGGGGGGGDDPGVSLTITNISASDVQGTFAVITWDTNEAADSEVDYGLTTSYELGTVSESSFVTSHSVTLENLEYTTTYHFRIRSETEDYDQNQTGDYEFTTVICDDGETKDCGENETGECSLGTETCSAGAWINCTAVLPSAEICDGLDNDCDGELSDDGVDEGWYNQESTCGQGECASVGMNLCQNGSQIDTCVEGDPVAEICDDILDNDCDGDTDADDTDCQCTIGSAQTCSTGELGICSLGQQTCLPDGTWGACIQVNDPVSEVCDDEVDNDCDGYIDNDDFDCRCTLGETLNCNTGDFGICSDGIRSCLADGTFSACQRVNEPTGEVCGDSLDNDCDSLTDEGCDCTQPWQCGPVTNVGECRFGQQACIDGILSDECDGAVFPAEEVCGDSLDNDCDGSTDENCCLPYWECVEWSDCTNGERFRTCIDRNGCGDIEGRPETIKSCVVECTLTCQDCQILNEDQCVCEQEVPCCGDGVCEEEESFASCYTDCPLFEPPEGTECGNDICEDEESILNCPIDCKIASGEDFAVSDCSDTIDNDGDGLIDFPDDPGCRNEDDVSEKNLVEEITEANMITVVVEVVDIIQDTIFEKILPEPIAAAIKNVIDNPVIEEIVHDIAAPAVVVVAATSVVSSFSLLNLFRRLIWLWLGFLTKIPTDLSDPE